MRNNLLFYFGIVILIGILGFVLAASNDIVLIGDNVNYTTIEDSVYYHNLSANITGTGADISFTIFTDLTNKLKWNFVEVSESEISSWISIINSSTGNLSINATYDNQTGFFEIPIRVSWRNITEGSTYTSGTTFEFIINATNDFPNITSINSTYNFTPSSSLSSYLNATDEENQYPLIFNVTFNSTNCTHAAWSGYTNNQNCSLYDLGFTLTHPNNISALMSMTPLNNYTGIYYANISVRDAGANYPCPHAYCDNLTYKVNKTTYYSTIVTFNIFSSLSVNVSDCQEKVFQENQSGTCNITIRTKGEADNLNFSSYGILRNYAAGQSEVSNTSWFKANESVTSSNFEKNITINITPQKTEIGNWTINFTINDLTHDENSTTQIYVRVNRTTNDIPDLSAIANVNTSMNLATVINLTVYDDDLLVPDKNSSYGGFNETINFTRIILNQSNLAQELTLSNFSITILQMPVAGTNRTTAEIRFTASPSDVGNYTINVSVRDSENTLDYGTFNLSIINNNYPYWNEPLTKTFLINEDSNLYLNLSQNATDPDGGTLTFTYVNDTSFSSFNLTSLGIINFTSIDEDVGQHIVNITISDGYLTNTTTFNFTVFNINDAPVILNIGATNATPSTINNQSSANATEDNYTIFILWVDDNDFKIPSGQKSFYNETLTINVTIQGANTSLFNFTRDYSWPITSLPNRTKYEAIFTPRKADVGDYNITINATDLSNSSSYITFNLTVYAINHDPVISTLSNQTSAVNRTFYYNINVTDTEDGNDTSGVNTNFTFSYSFLNGTDFINSNQTIFNTSMGILNLTFNSTQSGSYRLNITVNDSTGLIDSDSFWLFVYGAPNVSYPLSGSVFNLTENVTSTLNFTVNHSVGDNLTYAFYIDGLSYDGSNLSYSSLILRNSTNYYGNGTSYNWTFAPNMTDQTYNLLKNLTLVVYSNSSSLVNASEINTTINFKLNITNANSPITFSGHIADLGPTAYGTPITLDLSPYFSDVDYSDSYYAQTVTFTVNSNTSSITSSVSSAWLATFSATSAITGLISLTGSDGSSSATSNSFVVEFVAPTIVSSSTSTGGGGTTEVPVSLKIIMPDPTSAYKKDRIELPITLENDGSVVLNDITLNGSVAKDGSLIGGINISFSQDKFSRLAVGEKQNLTMFIDINTQEEGNFEINVMAKVSSPSYTDWGKMFLTIKEGENIMEKILFTEEFIVENPECLELTELINEAKEYFKLGNEEMAIEKSGEALQACRDAIAQAGKPKIKQIIENKLYRYLIISTLGLFLIGIAFYSYKRINLKRRRGSFLQESIKNKKYLDLSSNK